MLQLYVGRLTSGWVDLHHYPRLRLRERTGDNFRAIDHGNGRWSSVYAGLSYLFETLERNTLLRADASTNQSVGGHDAPQISSWYSHIGNNVYVEAGAELERTHSRVVKYSGLDYTVNDTIHSAQEDCVLLYFSPNLACRLPLCR